MCSSDLVEALRRGDDVHSQEELGDVLMNVFMIAQIGQERGAYDLDTIAEHIAKKLIRRHPHVFGDPQQQGAKPVAPNWERLKLEEQAAKAGPGTGALSGVPRSLPALLQAYRIGEKAARIGFDWPDRTGPRQKIDEELGELDAAIASGDSAAVASELGDVLFSLCNLARHLKAEPEMALRGTIDRFLARFSGVEEELGPDLTGRTLAELDAAWTRSKQRLANDKPPTETDG